MGTKIYNLIILDASGSMTKIARQAVSGCNETIQTIRAAQEAHPEQEHFLSLMLFNGEGRRSVYDRTPMEDVKELCLADYCPNSLTPLYDEMGFSINELNKHVVKGDKVIVTIITDGYENASIEFNRQSIARLVDDLKAKDWVFTYIGANQDLLQVEQDLHIWNTLSFDASLEGTHQMFCSVNRAQARFFDRLSKADNIISEEMNEDYFEE